MARRKKKGGGGGGGDGWLVTFSDLMTLLLTFFVLLLSMASMDQSKISRIQAFSGNPSNIEASGTIKALDRIKLVAKALQDLDRLQERQQMIRDMLFPDDVLPPEIPRSTFEENMKVLARPEGAALVLTEKLLFAPGSATITPTAQKLLQELTPLLLYTTMDINVAGFTDPARDSSDGELPIDQYGLSAMRAKAVMDFFIRRQVSAKRFSLSGYGPDRPLTAQESGAGPSKNSRVEILLKTVRWVGQY